MHKNDAQAYSSYELISHNAALCSYSWHELHTQITLLFSSHFVKKVLELGKHHHHHIAKGKKTPIASKTYYLVILPTVRIHI